MCWNKEVSFSIGLTAFISGLYFTTINVNAGIAVMYFSLMEILQSFQYTVIDECDNNLNVILTIIGYIHICFQPFFINLWFFAFAKKINYSLLYICLIGGFLLLSRLVSFDKHKISLNIKDNEVCDSNNEPLCGKKTCSLTGEKHIVWNIRMRAAGKYWWTPSMGLHFFLFVIPILTTFEMKPLLALLLSGPYFGYFLANDISEQASIWCLTVTLQLIITFFLLHKTI